MIISNKTKANNKQGTNASSLGAKSNLYYYHDQHSLHNNDALQSENEQYTTACTAQHTNTTNTTSYCNKSPPQNSFQHTTFHNLKKTNAAANTLSTLNPSEFEAKANKSFAKKHSKSTKSLQKNNTNSNNNSSGNKFYGIDDDYKVDNDFCDNDILTSHYYHHNNKMSDDRKGKKAKR